MEDEILALQIAVQALADSNSANAKAVELNIKALQSQRDVLLSTVHAQAIVTASLVFVLKDAGVDVEKSLLIMLDKAATKIELPETKALLNTIARAVKGPRDEIPPGPAHVPPDLRVILGGRSPDTPQSP